MTKIFLLMWLADTVGNIGAFAAIAFCGLGIAVITYFLFSESGADFKVLWRIAKWVLPFVIFTAFLPSQKTIQLLAVASASEVATSTELGQKGLQALNAVLDKVIESQKADKK